MSNRESKCLGNLCLTLLALFGTIPLQPRFQRAQKYVKNLFPLVESPLISPWLRRSAENENQVNSLSLSLFFFLSPLSLSTCSQSQFLLSLEHNRCEIFVTSFTYTQHRRPFFPLFEKKRISSSVCALCFFLSPCNQEWQTASKPTYSRFVTIRIY